MAEQGQAKEGLRLVEKAYLHATEHGYAPLAAEIEPVIEDIRSKLQGSPPPPGSSA